MRINRTDLVLLLVTIQTHDQESYFQNIHFYACHSQVSINMLNKAVINK